MVRIGMGVSYLALCVAVAGCSKSPESPGITMGQSSNGDSSNAGETEEPSSGGDGVSDSATSSVTTASTGSNSNGSSAETTTATGSASSGGETAGMGCGDGAVSPGEQCDGADLQGFTCATLGLGTGTLTCDPQTCTFDGSMCESTPGGTGGA